MTRREELLQVYQHNPDLKSIDWEAAAEKETAGWDRENKIYDADQRDF